MATSKDWQCNKRLGECLGHMLDTATCTDVSFFVGGAKKGVHAHKLILISRSPVFYAMFKGPLSEKGRITVPDINKDIFEQFLRYLYTDDVKLTCDNVRYLLYAAKKYCVDLLAQKCREFIKTSLNPQNACTLLEHSHICSEDRLAMECREIIFENPNTCLTIPSFTDLCSACVLSITESPYLMVSEEKVYMAALKWSEAECRRQKLDVNDANKRTWRGMQWTQHKGRCDALSFSLSKPAKFNGIRVYGAESGSGEYDIILRLYDQNDTIIGHVSRKIHTEQSADIFDMEMDDPIQLQKYTEYTVAIELTGPHAKWGDEGIEKVSVDGIDIRFTNSNKSTNGTCVSHGQIPCLLVSFIR